MDNNTLAFLVIIGWMVVISLSIVTLDTRMFRDETLLQKIGYFFLLLAFAGFILGAVLRWIYYVR